MDVRSNMTQQQSKESHHSQHHLVPPRSFSSAISMLTRAAHVALALCCLIQPAGALACSALIIP
jgi:hypothetical protein